MSVVLLMGTQDKIVQEPLELPGLESIMKKRMKYIKSLQKCEVYKLQQKSDLGVVVYMIKVALNFLLGKK